MPRSNAPDATGAGLKIGIIDSGIDLDHEAFQDDSLPALPGYPRGRPLQLRFASRKIITLRTYVHLLNSGQPATSTPDDTTPRDSSGHGTAVAMIAAGARVDSPAGPVEGVAPKAYLGVYKVSGTPGINSNPTSQAVIAAIDDAVADGMDILNLSMGAPARFPWAAYGYDCGEPDQSVDCDPLSVAAQSAVVDFDRVVVAAAGNAGDTGLRAFPARNTVASPAIAPDVIAVAATLNSKEIVEGVRVGSTVYPAQTGAGPGVDGSLTAALALADGFGNPLACAPFPSGSLSDRIVLVKRGTCFFVDKIEHADAAGAIGVVVYNDQGTDDLLEMASIEATDIPAYFIGARDGDALVASVRELPLGSAVEATLDAAPVARTTDWTQVGGYSARGPSPGLNLKPDIAAPGIHVYSAAARQASRPGSFRPSGFREYSGTSMAAPVVAGSAALVWQDHPEFTAREVASALINTASQTVMGDG